MAGSYAPNGNRYIPQLTTQGTTDYAQIVINETATDAWMQAVEGWEAGTDAWIVTTEAWMQVRAMYGDTGYTTLAEALTTIGSTQMALEFPSVAGAVSVAINTTIPDNVQVIMREGAYFSVANGVTLSIDGPLMAGPYQIFSCIGNGSVTFGSRVFEVYPDWWATNTTPGTTSMAAAIQAATSSLTNGIVQFLPTTYAIDSTINGKSSVGYRGATDNADWSAGTVLKLTAATPMFVFEPVNGYGMTGWSFKSIYLDYNSNNNELIMAMQSDDSPYRGSFGIKIEKCYFNGGGTNLYAENAWDWIITDSTFTANAANGAALYFYNGNKSASDYSNWMHITNNFINSPEAIGIISDSTGMGIPNAFFMISNNHFEANVWVPATGMPCIAGTLNASMITNNGFGQTGLGYSCVDLGSVWAGGVGRNNVISNNVFWDSGGYSITLNDQYDAVIGNTFFYGGRSSSPAFIHLDTSAWKCRIIGNVGDEESNPMVFDDGTNNTVALNSGTDGAVNGSDQLPVVLDGVSYLIQLIP